MKIILTSFILLLSLLAYSQQPANYPVEATTVYPKIPSGTIWKTKPVYSISRRDSVQYSVKFTNGKAELSMKHKKYAYTEVITILPYPFPAAKPFYMGVNESCAFMKDFKGDSFHLTAFTQNKRDSVLKTEGTFYLHIRNTLNGTVWAGDDGTSIYFDHEYMRFDGNETIIFGNFRTDYNLLDNGIIELPATYLKAKMLPGRKSFEMITIQEGKYHPKEKIVYRKVEPGVVYKTKNKKPAQLWLK